MNGERPHDRIQVLIITGNDHFHHRWRAATTRFREILEQHPHFEVRVTEVFDGATAATLERFDVVLLNYFGGERPTAPERRWGEVAERALFDFVREGGGLVVLHGSFWMGEAWGPDGDELISLFGGVMRSGSRRAPGQEVDVHLTDTDHPITRGLATSFVSPVDDKYINMTFAPMDELTVLAETTDPAEAYLGGAYYAMSAMPGPKIYDIETARGLTGADQRHPVIWVKSYGEGRVFALTIGHVGASTIQDAHRGRREGREIGPSMDIATRVPHYAVMLARGTEWAATGTVVEREPEPIDELID